MKPLFFTLLAIISQLAQAQVNLPPMAAKGYFHELTDRGIAPVTAQKPAPYHAPTPTAIPGGRIIETSQLKALLDAKKDMLVVDVLDVRGRLTIPGAKWMPGAGEKLYDGEKERLAKALFTLTEGNKSKPVVFLCLDAECWLSYNAALIAIGAGYTDVLWYRGGSQAWRGANLDVVEPEKVSW